MDVVVPYARTMADLLEILDVVVADDADKRGDLWRLQPWVPIPAASSVRPASYLDLAVDASSLKGKRFGVPRMYINADAEAGTSEKPGIGGPTGQRIVTRDSVIALWQQARKALEAAGAEVLEVDFPLVSNCEGDRPGRRPSTTAASSARNSSMTSCGSCRAGPSTTSCGPTMTPSSTAWPMSTARRSSARPGHPAQP